MIKIVKMTNKQLTLYNAMKYLVKHKSKQYRFSRREYKHQWIYTLLERVKSIHGRYNWQHIGQFSINRSL